MSSEDDSIQRREKNFTVETTLARYSDYEDEVNLSISHNGFQFTSVHLSRQEAEKVINALDDHFGFTRQHSPSLSVAVEAGE